MNKEVKLLTISAKFFKILAWLAAGFYLVVAISVLLGAGGEDTPRAASAIFLLAGLIHFVIIYTVSLAIGLLLAINNKVMQFNGSITDKSANNSL